MQSRRYDDKDSSVSFPPVYQKSRFNFRPSLVKSRLREDGVISDRYPCRARLLAPTASLWRHAAIATAVLGGGSGAYDCAVRIGSP